MKKLKEIVADQLLEILTNEHTLPLSDNDLLAIKLREQVFESDHKVITGNPLCLATSAELGQKGKKVFWLMSGGLMESSIDFSHATQIGAAPVSLGFKASSLIDYQSFQPYTKDSSETIKSVLKNLTVELPLDSQRAMHLLPGSSFHLLGRATAKLSAGLSFTKGAAGIGVAADGSVSGEFAVQVSRGAKDMVTVSISQIVERSKSITGKASLSWSIGTGKIVEHKWFQRGQESINTLDVDYITGSLPGWEDDQRLGDYLAQKGVDALEDYLENYSSFYMALGHKTTHTTRGLVKYILDLSTVGGRKVYDALSHLDENEAAAIAKSDAEGVERVELKESKTAVKTSAEAGFHGKKLLLSSTLRSIREGSLIYDDHVQVMALHVQDKMTVLFNNNQQLTWEGFDVQVDGEDRGKDYWRFCFKRHDAVTTEEEIDRFVDFASLVKNTPLKIDNVKGYSLLQRVFTKKDNTDFTADIYFTEDGVNRLAHVSDHDVRKAVFASAVGMNDISPGLMFEDETLQGILLEYLQLGLEWDDDPQREKMINEYMNINGRARSQIKDDALIMQKADILVSHIRMLHRREPSEWGGVFLKLGKAVKSDFMVIVAAICNVVGTDDTFISSLQIKRQKDGKVLLTAKEDGTIMKGEDIFNQAQKVVVDAKA